MACLSDSYREKNGRPFRLFLLDLVTCQTQIRTCRRIGKGEGEQGISQGRVDDREREEVWNEEESESK